MYLEIYPDVVFVLNLVIDFLLLLLLKIIVHRKCGILRLFSAAFIGGMTAIFISFLPWFRFAFEGSFLLTLLQVVCILIKPVSMVGMVRLAFGKMNWKEWIRYSILFFLITGFAGGFLQSVYYHTKLRLILIQLDASMLLSNIPMRYILLSFLGLVPVTTILVWLRKRYLSCKKDIYEIELICGEKSAKVMGLMDTGNCLFDPRNHRPVIIVEKHIMEQLVPSECSLLLQVDEAGILQSEAAVSQELLDQYSLRFHIIPYQSIGKEQGVMPGIVLDRIRIKVGEEICCQESVTAAIYNRTLSSGGEYQVILHKGLLEGK